MAPLVVPSAESFDFGAFSRNIARHGWRLASPDTNEMEARMYESDHADDHAIRERAYFIWQQEGRPAGRALEHWVHAATQERERKNELMHDEEKVLSGRPDVDMPALLTKDVHGG
jgi:hypothetical protein